MASVKLTGRERSVFEQWWHESTALSGALPPDLRSAWLEQVSEVVRLQRQMEKSHKPSDRRFYGNLCRLALSHSSVGLHRHLINGHLSLLQAQKLHGLEHRFKELLTEL